MIDGRHVYIKQYVPGGWRQTTESVKAQAIREVEILQSLNSLQVNTFRNLGLLKVVDCDVEQSWIITEEVDGTDLERLIVNHRYIGQRESCTKALYHAGKWLRILQKLPIGSNVYVSAINNPAHLADYCEVRLYTLMNLGYRWPSEKERKHLLTWLQKCVAATPDELLDKVWCHGDYGPANMIWDGRKLTPIDFATCHPDYPLSDLTYLIHRLELLPLQFPWRKWPVAKWRRACIDGYGLSQAEDLPIYKALMVRHLLCRMQTLVRQPPKNTKQKWHNIWVRNLVLFKLKRMIQ